MTRIFLAVSVFAAVLFSVMSASAGALQYVRHGELTGHTFASPWGVAVNQTTGDVYVADRGAGPAAVEQFNAKGEWQSSTAMPAGSSEIILGLAVDNASGPEQGDVYVADLVNGVAYKFDANAKGELAPDTVTPIVPKTGTVSNLRGIAVDASGNVYLASAEAGTVSEFSATGEPVDENFITGFSEPYALAVDASGNIYVAGDSGTREYTSAGVCISPCGPINADPDNVGVGVDSLGDVLVTDAAVGAVDVYKPNAEHSLIESPQLDLGGTFASPRGLAVDTATNILYVDDEGSQAVKIFELIKAKPPVVKTEPATQVRGAVEALNGTVNPNGTEDSAEYYFEYGTAPCEVAAGRCGTKASEQSEVPLHGEAAIPVAVRLENLAPNTKYYFWAAGVNEDNGVVHGEQQSFTTGPEPTPPVEPPDEPISTPGPGAAPTPFPSLGSIRPVAPRVAPPAKKAAAKKCSKGKHRVHGKCVKAKKKTKGKTATKHKQKHKAKHKETK
jgi:hypothetical protein